VLLPQEGKAKRGPKSSCGNRRREITIQIERIFLQLSKVWGGDFDKKWQARHLADEIPSSEFTRSTQIGSELEKPLEVFA